MFYAPLKSSPKEILANRPFLFRHYPRDKSHHVFTMIRLSDHVRRPTWQAPIRVFFIPL